MQQVAPVEVDWQGVPRVGQTIGRDVDPAGVALLREADGVPHLHLGGGRVNEVPEPMGGEIPLPVAALVDVRIQILPRFVQGIGRVGAFEGDDDVGGLLAGSVKG